MIQSISTWVFILNLCYAKDVSHHPAWTYLDSFDCGYSVTDRIIGGEFAALGQFPWIVRLGFQLNNAREPILWLCGGALLSDRHVLSAAHCVQPTSEESYTLKLVALRMGEHDLQHDPDCELGVCAPPFQDRNVKIIDVHPRFQKPPFHNDIALIVLQKPVQLSDYVTPICLPRGEQLKDLAVGEYITAAGWGKTNMTTEETSRTLKYVQLPVVRKEQCNFFGKIFKAGESHICAGGVKNQDACGGDSGGPVMKVFDTVEGPKNVLVGVVSFGPAICGIKRPAVYTSAAHFMTWILDQVVDTNKIASI